MDYKTIWNEICFHTKKNRDTTEQNFQTIVEFIFEKIGWSQYNGEIVSKKAIPFGSAQKLVPDIIIKQNDKDILVVELKKPNSGLSNRNAEQLSSYMRQLKINFGILFGETLQLYYELPNENKPPINIIEIQFIEDSCEGVELIRLLSKKDFSLDALQKYCEEKYEIAKKYEISEKEALFLCSVEGVKKVVDLIKDNFLKNFSEETVSLIFDKVNIHISKKEDVISIQSSRNLISPVQQCNFILEFVPSDEKLFKQKLLQTKRAKRTWFYLDGRIITDIWNASNFTEESNLHGNIHSNNKVRQRNKTGLFKIKFETIE